MRDEQVDEYCGLPDMVPVVMENELMQPIYLIMHTKDDEKEKGMLLSWQE